MFVCILPSIVCGVPVSSHCISNTKISFSSLFFSPPPLPGPGVPWESNQILLCFEAELMSFLLWLSLLSYPLASQSVTRMRSSHCCSVLFVRAFLTFSTLAATGWITISLDPSWQLCARCLPLCLQLSINQSSPSIDVPPDFSTIFLRLFHDFSSEVRRHHSALGSRSQL